MVQNATAELLGSQQQMAPVSSPHELPITLYSDCQKLADVARRLYKKEKYQEAKSICKKMVSALKINAQQIDEIEANELAMANDDAMDIDDSNSQVAVEVDDSAQAQRAAVKIRIRKVFSKIVPSRLFFLDGPASIKIRENHEKIIYFKIIHF